MKAGKPAAPVILTPAAEPVAELPSQKLKLSRHALPRQRPKRTDADENQEPQSSLFTEAETGRAECEVENR
jgi:hypothetical protein